MSLRRDRIADGCPLFTLVVPLFLHSLRLDENASSIAPNTYAIVFLAELWRRGSEGTHLYRHIQPHDNLVLNYRQPARIGVR